MCAWMMNLCIECYCFVYYWWRTCWTFVDSLDLFEHSHFSSFIVLVFPFRIWNHCYCMLEALVQWRCCRLGGGSCHLWLTDRIDARRTWPHCFWIILVTATDQMVLEYFQNSSLISVTALFPLTLRESLAIFPKRMHWMFLSFLFEVSKSLR